MADEREYEYERDRASDRRAWRSDDAWAARAAGDRRRGTRPGDIALVALKVTGYVTLLLGAFTLIGVIVLLVSS
ncbi:hypothetical protein I3I95_06115 [bacterium]|nr:hypothetical protein [bacterium]